MANDEMADFWNTRGGRQWVEEQDHYETMLEPCGRRLIDAAALHEGERVLDVGCGSGATTLEAARRVGPGRAQGIDLSGPMLASARGRAADLGLDVTFLQGDAQTAAFEQRFDAVISRFGVMFFDDPEAAFANMAGALAPGGRLCFVCWQELLGNEWITVPAGAVIAHVGMPEFAEPGAPGPFALADPARLHALLAGAGLVDVIVEEASDPLVVGRDIDDVVAFLTSDEMGRRLLEGKDPATVTAALDAARLALEPYAGADGVVLGGAYFVVRAKKP